MLSDYKTFYEAVVIRTVRCKRKNRWSSAQQEVCVWGAWFHGRWDGSVRCCRLLMGNRCSGRTYWAHECKHWVYEEGSVKSEDISNEFWNTIRWKCRGSSLSIYISMALAGQLVKGPEMGADWFLGLLKICDKGNILFSSEALHFKIINQ